jgi:predicted nucleic acid-binding protein
MNKIFVDTNILIYAYSSTELKKRQLSLDILSGDNIIISTQVINEFIWVMQRKFSIDLKLINQVVKGLFISYRAGIIDQEIITKAISISGKYGYSYWDSLILASAVINNCKYVYTEDMQHNQIVEKRVQIKNPFME